MTVAYIAAPSVLFVATWVVAPLGPAAAICLVGLVGWLLAAERVEASATTTSMRGWAVAATLAFAWCLLDGQGHFVYANSDWWVRDAVLLDLVRDPWPVTYRIDGAGFVLRAPIGYYLPAALIGKVLGIRTAELCLAAQTWLGVSIVFAWLLHDRPTLRAALTRLLVFILFSGMDILPTVTRHYFSHIGDMIEWWQKYLMYGSSTTLLFWAPNHTLPGWVAIAWLSAQPPQRVSSRIAALFVLLIPISAPLTALGVLPIFAVALLRRARLERSAAAIAAAFDPRVLACAIIVVALEVPYLLSGSGAIAVGLMSDMPWVGEEATSRYLEFVFFEFGLLAVLLIKRDPRDPLVWASTIVLLTLPFLYFGPYNDLAMRTSIPALAVFAITIGRWLTTSTRRSGDAGSRVLVVALLAVGAVTPAMEIARAVLNPAWPMNVRTSVYEVVTAQGSHYLTSADRPWLSRFIVDAP